MTFNLHLFRRRARRLRSSLLSDRHTGTAVAKFHGERDILSAVDLLARLDHVAFVLPSKSRSDATIRNVDLEIEMLLNTRTALSEHDESCGSEAKAILFNPGNFDLIGWDEALGLPVLPDDRVEPLRARVLCGVGTGGHCAEGKVIWDEEGGAYVLTKQPTDT